MNQTSDPCKCNTPPAGACSTDYADVSRRCGKVHREHATVALLSLPACMPASCSRGISGKWAGRWS